MNYINNPKYLFGIKALLQRDIVLMLTKTHEQILFMKTAGDTPIRLPQVSKKTNMHIEKSSSTGEDTLDVEEDSLFYRILTI